MYTKYDAELELNSKWSPRMNFLFSVYSVTFYVLYLSALTIKMNWKKNELEEKCFCQKLEFEISRECQKIRN